MEIIKTLDEFDTIIKNEKVLVDFSAEWSMPCKMLDIVVEEIEQEHPEITCVKVDADRFRNIAKEYKVVNVPEVCFFSKGKCVNQKSGLMRKEELLELIQQW